MMALLVGDFLPNMVSHHRHRRYKTYDRFLSEITTRGGWIFPPFPSKVIFQRQIFLLGNGGGLGDKICHRFQLKFLPEFLPLIALTKKGKL